MIRAYDEIYLDDTMNNLGDMFDYAVNDCGFNSDDFFTYFIISGVAKAIERGNPKYVAGLSGPELAAIVIYRTFHYRPDIPSAENIDKSPEYWAGWVLAYYQWYKNRRFSDIQKYGLTMSNLLSLYPTLHEADISKFVSVADSLIKKNTATRASNLQRIRKANHLTQKKLSEVSGVALRMIQLYEQRKKDIDKAQASTLFRLAHVLNCSTNDLIEN